MGFKCYAQDVPTKILFEKKGIQFAVFPFIAKALMIFGLSILVVNKYSSIKKDLKYFILIITGWYLAFFILVLLPIDVSNAFYQNCVCNQFAENGQKDISLCENLIPQNAIDFEVLKIMFAIIYWIIFFLTWLVYPLVMTYSISPQFSVWDRIKSTLVDNAIFYGIAGAGIIVLFFVIFFTTANRMFSQCIGILIALATCWGLFLMIVFIGVGIVTVPKSSWERSNILFKLAFYEHCVGKYYCEYGKNYKALNKVLKKIKKVETLISRAYEKKWFSIILENCPEEYKKIESGEGKVEITESGLVKLNEELITCLYEYNSSKTLFHRFVEKAFMMQDVKTMRERNTYYHICWALQDVNVVFTKIPFLGRIWNFVEWLYWRYIVDWIWKFFALLEGFLGIVLLWSEVTMFASVFMDGVPRFSIYHLLIWKPHYVSPVFIQFLCVIVLGYNARCTYHTLIRIRIFKWYRMLPYQQTSVYSMFFYSSYLCRISIPLCLNLLYLTGFDRTKYTSFMVIMGSMSVVPFFGGKFHLIFPFLLIIISFITILNLWPTIFRIFTCGQWKSFEFNEYEDEYSLKGKELLKKEREANASGVGIMYFSEIIVRRGLLKAGSGIDRKTQLHDEEIELFPNGEKSFANENRETTSTDVNTQEGGNRSILEKFFSNDNDYEKLNLENSKHNNSYFDYEKLAPKDRKNASNDFRGFNMCDRNNEDNIDEISIPNRLDLSPFSIENEKDNELNFYSNSSNTLSSSNKSRISLSGPINDTKITKPFNEDFSDSYSLRKNDSIDPLNRNDPKISAHGHFRSKSIPASFNNSNLVAKKESFADYEEILEDPKLSKIFPTDESRLSESPFSEVQSTLKDDLGLDDSDSEGLQFKQKHLEKKYLWF